MPVVMVADRPKPGQQAAREKLVSRHVPDSRAWGLAADRPSRAMRAKAGIVVATVEGADGAVQRALASPRVPAMRSDYGAVCDDPPIGQAPEAAQLFTSFAAIG